MAGGQGAAKRANAKRAKAKSARKKAAQETGANAQNTPSIPPVTEDDLLAFQTFHFADDTKPEVWFVPAETALNYNPALEDDLELEDEGLGYYEDGVKRTLTDEQIEMFRHSEMETMLREERLQEETNDSLAQETDAILDIQQTDLLPESAVSPVSSMEDDLLGLAEIKPPVPLPIPPARAPSQSGRSEASSLSSNQRRRPKKLEIPYNERNKRKWEEYIEGTDPVEGSLTHRRIVREMDEMHDTNVDLDY